MQNNLSCLNKDAAEKHRIREWLAQSVARCAEFSRHATGLHQLFIGLPAALALDAKLIAEHDPEIVQIGFEGLLSDFHHMVDNAPLDMVKVNGNLFDFLRGCGREHPYMSMAKAHLAGIWLDHLGGCGFKTVEALMHVVADDRMTKPGCRTAVAITHTAGNRAHREAMIEAYNRTLRREGDLEITPSIDVLEAYSERAIRAACRDPRLKVEVVQRSVYRNKKKGNCPTMYFILFEIEKPVGCENYAAPTEKDAGTYFYDTFFMPRISQRRKSRKLNLDACFKKRGAKLDKLCRVANVSQARPKAQDVKRTIATAATKMLGQKAKKAALLSDVLESGNPIKAVESRYTAIRYFAKTDPSFRDCVRKMLPTIDATMNLDFRF